MRHGPVLAAIVVLLAFGGAGCGGDSSPDESGDAFAKRPAADIVSTARAEMAGLKAVHYTGEVNSNGSRVSLDIQSDAQGDCTGTVGIAGGTATVLARGGSNWFKGDADFWHGTAGDQADQVIAAVGDKWVLDTSDNFTKFCSLKEFIASVFSRGQDATYRTDGITTIGGDRVVKVAASQTGANSGSGSAASYVLVDGEHHYLVRIDRSTSQASGRIDFDEFDRPFTVQAPAAADVVDPSTL